MYYFTSVVSSVLEHEWNFWVCLWIMFRKAKKVGIITNQYF